MPDNQHDARARRHRARHHRSGIRIEQDGGLGAIVRDTAQDSQLIVVELRVEFGEGEGDEVRSRWRYDSRHVFAAAIVQPADLSCRAVPNWWWCTGTECADCH